MNELKPGVVFAMFLGVGSWISQCDAQTLVIMPLRDTDSGAISVPMFTQDDSELNSLFSSPTPHTSEPVGQFRLLQHQKVQKMLGITNDQARKLSAAVKSSAQDSQRRALKELGEFGKFSNDLVRKGEDEKEIKAFVKSQMEELFAKLSKELAAEKDLLVESVLTQDQIRLLTTIRQRAFLSKVGLGNYLTNDEVLGLICESKKREVEISQKVQEISDGFDAELAQLRMRFQRKMIDSLTDDESKALSRVLNIEHSKLRSTPLNADMLLSKAEKNAP